MTILFVTRKFPPAVGGMEAFAYDLHASLGKKVSTKLVKWGGSNKYLPFVLPCFFIRACWLLLWNKDINVVHMQDVVLAPLGYLLSRIFRKPFSVVVHGLDITYDNKLYQLVNVRCVQKADVVFCISQAAGEEACKRGVDLANIVVIPLGITDEHNQSNVPARRRLHQRLGLSDNTVIILTVGRLVERKGVAWFIRSVMPILAMRYPRFMYLVVGDGEERGKIEQLIAQLHLEAHVRMLGKVTDGELPDLYNGAEVFVQPNIPVVGDIEGFGRVLLEASLCELPIVAAGIEGIKDAIADGENGILVPAKDIDGFVREIGRFIGNDTTSSAFGKKSRRYTLAHYQWGAIADRYVQEYERISPPLHRR